MKQLASGLTLGLFLLTLALISCEKDNSSISPTQRSLMAHTWQVETVTDYQAGNPTVIYQRGAANNEEDFSMVQQTYKSNGTVQYVDQFGNSGNNGSYSLLDNDTKIRLGFGGFTVIGENLKVTGSEFAYTLKHSATDSTRFVFSPL